MCRFTTSPCVPAKRAHVSLHLLAYLSRTPFSSNSNFQQVPVLLCFCFLACSGASTSVPSGIARGPTFCTTPCRVHFGLLSSPCHLLPDALCTIFSACVWDLLATTLGLEICLAFFFSQLLPHIIQRHLFGSRSPLHSMLLCFHFSAKRSTSLLAWVLVVHFSFPPPDRESLLRTSALRKPPLFSAALYWVSFGWWCRFPLCSFKSN